MKGIVLSIQFSLFPLSNERFRKTSSEALHENGFTIVIFKPEFIRA